MRKSFFLTVGTLLGSAVSVSAADEVVSKTIAKVADAAIVIDKANTIPMEWYLAPFASILAILVAAIFYKKMMSASEGNDVMKEIAGHVREGAMAYLFRQYRVVGIVFVVLMLILAVLAAFGIQNPFVPVAFLTGGFFSENTESIDVGSSVATVLVLASSGIICVGRCSRWSMLCTGYSSASLLHPMFSSSSVCSLILSPCFSAVSIIILVSSTVNAPLSQNTSANTAPSSFAFGIILLLNNST